MLEEGLWGLTHLGLAHTGVAIAALMVASTQLIGRGRIDLSTRAGLLYAVLTAFVAASSFGLFIRGGIGPAHILAALTLAALCVAALATWTRLFGKLSIFVATLALSATLLFHLIPGASETLTRLPIDAPYASAPTAPAMRPVYLGLLLLFLAGAATQILVLRRRASKTSETP